MIPTSISVTYHFGARDIFVGSLMVVAFFLAAYNGRKLPTDEYHWESLAAKLAGFCAAMVALFPTSCSESWLPVQQHFSVCEYPLNPAVPVLHTLAAVILIILLVFFCWRFYQRTDNKLQQLDQFKQSGVLKGTEQEKNCLVRRRSAYALCAAIMVITSVIGVILDRVLGDNNQAIFWVEGICLWAFGFSWLIAGKLFPGLHLSEDTERQMTMLLKNNYSVNQVNH